MIDYDIVSAVASQQRNRRTLFVKKRDSEIKMHCVLKTINEDHLMTETLPKVANNDLAVKNRNKSSFLFFGKKKGTAGKK